MLAAVVARLPDPQINLAAYGSVANPLISILQAPILTLLSLSNSLSRDWDSFLKGRRLMYFIAGGLTLLYIGVVFTPAYSFIVRQVIGAPEEIVEPARLAMMVAVPWTFSVAYRRFHQGVMIRFDHSRTVTTGTLLRFAADLVVLTAGYLSGALPGAVLAALMMTCGVITEAVYVGFAVRPVLRNEVRPAPPVPRRLEQFDLLMFYLPLAVTPLLNMLVRPIGSAALSRMPDPLTALAVYPVVASLSALLLTPGWAFNEVVNALIDKPGAKRALLRFLVGLAAGEALLVLLFAASPLAGWWFGSVSGLNPADSSLAARALWLFLPSCLIGPLNGLFSGAILNTRHPRPITEGMLIFLGVYSLLLWLGSLGQASVLQGLHGLYIIILASIAASLCQSSWLWLRSRKALASLD